MENNMTDKVSAEAPAPDLVERLLAEGRHFRGEPDCVGPAVTLLVERAAAEIARLTAEVERLRAALPKMIELAEFWIEQGRETGMSKERYEVWLALGHRSKAMIEARAAALNAWEGAETRVEDWHTPPETVLILPLPKDAADD
jgi:hypothetical protein